MGECEEDFAILQNELTLQQPQGSREAHGIFTRVGQKRKRYDSSIYLCFKLRSSKKRKEGKRM